MPRLVAGLHPRSSRCSGPRDRCTSRSATTWRGCSRATSTGVSSWPSTGYSGWTPTAEQRWSTYAAGVLGFSFVGVILLYLLQRLQTLLPMAFDRATQPRAGRDGVQHRDLVRDQHELAVLRAGDDARSHRADGRADRAERRVGSGRHRGRDRADPRVRPPQHRPVGQLLGRPDPHGRPPHAADLVRLRDRPHRDGRGDVAPVRHRRHRGRRLAAHASARARRVAGGDQGAGHERRRHLQRQLRPPVREPERAEQLRRVSSSSSSSRWLSPAPSGRWSATPARVSCSRSSWGSSGWRSSRSPGLSEAHPNGPAAIAAGGALEGKEVRFGIPSSIIFGDLDDRHVDRRGQLDGTTASPVVRAGSRS